MILNSLKTQCPQGHQYSTENTGYTTRGDGSKYRYCKTCKKAQLRKRRNFQGFEYNQNKCKYGHLLSDDNIYIRSDNRKRCKICMKHMVRNYQDLRRGLDSNYSIQDEIITRQLFNNSCFKCGDTIKLEIDHHYPISQGFGLSVSNAVLLCKSCNCSKNDTMPEYFYSSDELDILNNLLIKEQTV